MRGLLITLVVVLFALVVIGFLIFSGDRQYQPDQTANQQSQTGSVNEGNNVPETNNQTEAPTDTGTETQTQPQTYSAEIKGFAFSPATLNIKVGDTVIWTNKDNTRHTVTSDSGGEMDSEYLSKEETYSHTFTQAGTYKYHCRPHPYMKGTIVVE